MSQNRIGLFGGTFDPPHIGHLIMASEVRYRLGLTEVVLMVTNSPWQKSERVVTDPRTRVELLSAALDDHEGLVVGTDEIERGGPTYTAETLRRLHSRDGVDEVVLIMGADTAAGLDTWVEPHVVAELATLAIVKRPGSAPLQLGDRWRHEMVEAPLIDISSTEIRRRVASGEPITFMVPRSVCAVIERRRLYCVS